MKVYKFGGASVRTADGVRNIAKIVSSVNDDLFIVVSAMGKTTNAFEVVLDNFMKANRMAALQKLNEIENFHYEIIAELFENFQDGQSAVENYFEEIKEILLNDLGNDYDRWYDRIVSYGEILSTRIVATYLQKSGIENAWLDMRELLVTDSNFREANVHLYESRNRLRTAADFSKCKVFVGQGFIGSNNKGNPTTLGREGSDYTAAVVGNLLDAESVTIWKDVPGILNADPRLFANTVHIPELTYLDAVELAYSGAQVIHPKTIKPLENKQIPLYVRPFNQPEQLGSVIKSVVENTISVPVLVLRKDQVLISIRPRDFSFVLEESLSRAFYILNKHRMKISLIQSSAITISVCVDNSRYLSDTMDELANDFKVVYNDGLELLTIRGVTDEVVKEHTSDKEILLTQRTRRSARFLMREENLSSVE